MKQRFLIIKPSSLGDIATTLPLLCDLRRAYPEAEIDWLIHPSLAVLVEGHDAIHQLIPFDRKKLGAWWYRPSAFRLFWELIKTLRRNRYDLVIDAQGLFRSGFLTRISGAQVRIGFANAREFAAQAYTKKVNLPEDGKKMVAVERMRALTGPLSIESKTNKPAEFRMPVSAAANAAAYTLLQGAGMAGREYVAVIPGARWDTKRWPIDRYTQLVKHLSEAGHAVVLLGSPDEKPLCDRIQSKIQNMKSEILNIAGRTSLEVMIAMLARARLVVGNDSGPLHVAVALGRPVVALYGPTSPAFVGPYGQLDAVLRQEVPCHPCRRKQCDHHSCMNGLQVELVWERTRASLGDTANKIAKAPVADRPGIGFKSA